MEIYTGIWLDHQKAIIFSIAGETETRHIIHSGAQTRRRIPGEGKQYTRMGNAFITPEHHLEERIRHQLSRYYREIIDYIQDTTDLLILGPGEAKTELENMLRQTEWANKIQQVEAADRITDNQIAARVREFTAHRRAFRHPLNDPYTI